MTDTTIPSAEQLIIDTPVQPEHAGHKLAAISQLREVKDFRAREDVRREAPNHGNQR